MGELAGKEVVQLYVSDPESSLQRPVKELKGFAKVSLKPGESKPVTFTLEARDFAFYDPRQKDWIAESGEFTIVLAASSKDIRLSETIDFTSTRRLNYKFDEYSFFREFWNNEDTKAPPDRAHAQVDRQSRRRRGNRSRQRTYRISCRTSRSSSSPTSRPARSPRSRSMHSSRRSML